MYRNFGVSQLPRLPQSRTCSLIIARLLGRFISPCVQIHLPQLIRELKLPMIPSSFFCRAVSPAIGAPRVSNGAGKRADVGARASGGARVFDQTRWHLHATKMLALVQKCVNTRLHARTKMHIHTGVCICMIYIYI